MNYILKWIYDDVNKIDILIVGKEGKDYLVSYYYKEEGEMVSTWWGKDDISYYKEIVPTDNDLRQQISYIFIADDYLAGGIL